MSSAVISECGAYRYRLERELSRFGDVVGFIGVNPSTANAVVNDHTITKLMGFGQRHKWRKLVVGNLAATRSRDVKYLRGVSDPVGPENFGHLRQIMRDCDQVIVGWGAIKKLPENLRECYLSVISAAAKEDRPLWCFGVNRDGHPRHPLMLAYDTPLTLWSPP